MAGSVWSPFSPNSERKSRKMNRSELQSLLEAAEYDFERRFDERWALEWMQQNWWVQKGNKSCRRRKPFLETKSGTAGAVNADYCVIAADPE